MLSTHDQSGSLGYAHTRCRITSGDTVQLVEESLDINLLNNAVKFKFPHCSVLPGGVSIQETLYNVIILICTNQSVHRVLLPHPARMYRSVSRTRTTGLLSLQEIPLRQHTPVFGCSSVLGVQTHLGSRF